MGGEVHALRAPKPCRHGVGGGCGVGSSAQHNTVACCTPASFGGTARCRSRARQHTAMHLALASKCSTPDAAPPAPACSSTTTPDPGTSTRCAPQACIVSPQPRRLSIPHSQCICQLGDAPLLLVHNLQKRRCPGHACERDACAGKLATLHWRHALCTPKRRPEGRATACWLCEQCLRLQRCACVATCWLLPHCRALPANRTRTASRGMLRVMGAGKPPGRCRHPSCKCHQANLWQERLHGCLALERKQQLHLQVRHLQQIIRQGSAQGSARPWPEQASARTAAHQLLGARPLPGALWVTSCNL